MNAKHTLRTLLCIAILLFTVSSAYAGHILGGDLNYKYLGGDQYEITLDMYYEPENLYPDLGFGNADDWATFALYENVSNVGTHNSSLFTIDITDTSTFVTKFQACSSDTIYKYTKKFTYVGTVTIPSNPNGYILTYIRCCRDASNFINIDADLGVSLSTIIRPNNEQNSTPVFKEDPPRFVCMGLPFEHDFSCTDSDADDLVYSIVAPKDGGDDFNVRHEDYDFEAQFFPPFADISYAQGHSGTNPFGNGDLTINPNTGILSGSANIVGDYFVAVKVEEFRNGVKIGERIRDFAVEVIDCEIPIAVAEVNADTANPVSVCLNELVDFDASQSISTGSNLKAYSWSLDNGDSSNQQSFQYAFTQPGVYYPKLKVIDQGDCESENEISYIINVGTKLKYDLSDTVVCQYNELCIPAVHSYNSYLVEGNQYTPSAISFTWSGDEVNGSSDSVLCFTPQSNGLQAYNLSITDNHGCQYDTIITVDVKPAKDPYFRYNDTTFCLSDNDPIMVEKTSTGGQFFCNDASVNIDPNTGEFLLSNVSAGNTYFIQYSIPGNCPTSHTEKITITTDDQADVLYSPNQFCKNSTALHDAVINADSGIFSSLSPTLNLSNAFSGTINQTSSSVGKHMIKFKTAGACPDSMNYEIEILAVDSVTIAFDKSSYCKYGQDPILTFRPQNTGVFTVNNDNGFVHPNTGAIDLDNSTVGDMEIKFSVSETCPNDTVISLEIRDKDNTSFAYDATSFCKFENIVNPINLQISNGTFRSSNQGLVFQDNQGKINISQTDIGSYKIYHETSSDCANIDSFTVTILPNDDPSFNYDSTIYCQGQQDPSIRYVATSGVFYSNDNIVFEDSSTGVILSDKSASGDIQIIHRTNGNCPMEDSINIFIAPKIEINLMDTSIFDQNGEFDLSELITSGLSNGIWEGEYVEDNVFNPEKLFGNYPLTYTVENEACSLTTTHTIHVYGDPTYFFPNAFTPNSDNVNDNFLPLGNFQGIQQYYFAVYNRFGELVFESRDPAVGWDGKENKNVAPIGTYLYYMSLVNFRGELEEQTNSFLLLN